MEEKREVLLAMYNEDAKSIGIVLLVVLVLALSFSSIKNVPVNSVGIKYSNFRGTISEEPLQSGIQFKMPIIDRITTVSTELRSADIDNIKVTTKDAQTVEVDIELQYNILPENATKTFKQFRSTPEEDWINVFVYQRIQRGVQESASKYTVNEIMGSKRGEFQIDIDETVATALEENFLSLHTASVDDIAVSPTILQAIEDNAKAKQTVETARQNKMRQEVENETKIEEAAAQAEVKKIQAEAQANANRELTKGITPELINYLEAQARQEHGWYKYNNMKPNIVTEEE